MRREVADNIERARAVSAEKCWKQHPQMPCPQGPRDTAFDLPGTRLPGDRETAVGTVQTCNLILRNRATTRGVESEKSTQGVAGFVHGILGSPVVYKAFKLPCKEVRVG